MTKVNREMCHTRPHTKGREGGILTNRPTGGRKKGRIKDADEVAAEQPQVASSQVTVDAWFHYFPQIASPLHAKTTQNPPSPTLHIGGATIFTMRGHWLHNSWSPSNLKAKSDGIDRRAPSQ